MKYKLFLIMLFISIFCSAFSQQKSMDSVSAKDSIVFVHKNWKHILSEAKMKDKYIFVDANTSWCGPCKLLKTTTFKDKSVAAFFNNHFINASFDMEKGEGVALADKWKVDAYPSLIILNMKGEIVLEKIGYVEPKDLIDFAKQALSKKLNN
ncbi:hypothetical protein A9P82_10005 [Arachidicoccus ginsenosidimutans]|nr:hypothetical protein A9P82_10005 [Arachidicoccus sp. BS20]